MSLPQPNVVTLDDLKRSLDQRPAAIHLGAGVAIALSGQLLGSYGFLTAGLQLALDHKVITEDQYKRYRHALDSGDLQEQLMVGSFLEGRLRPQRKRFLEWLEKSVGDLAIADDAIAGPLLAAAQSGLLLSTTSYDHLLSKATGLPTVSWQDFHDIEQLQNPPTLLHLEGTWDKPDSIVIAVRQDQKASVHREAIQAFLSPLRFLLLVGVGPGFFTSTMCQVLQARRGTLPGALLCRAEDIEDFQRRLADSLHWFQLVPYEGGFNALPKVLEKLFGDTNPPKEPSNRGDEPTQIGRTTLPIKTNSAVLDVAWSSGRSWLVAGQKDGGIQFVGSGAEHYRFSKLNVQSINCVQTHRSFPIMVAGCEGGTLIWIHTVRPTLAAGAYDADSSGHEDVWSLSFHPTLGDIAVAREAGHIELWAPTVPLTEKGSYSAPYKLRFRAYAHPQGAVTVAFSADGQTLASGGNDHAIRFWSIPELKPLRSFEGHENSVHCLAYNPDGISLASAGSDKSVILWDVKTGQPLWRAKEHSDEVLSLAFHPSGKLIATGSLDQTVRLWSAADGKQVALLRGHTGIVRAVAFSPDGTTLASGGDDKTIRLWPIDVEALVSNTTNVAPPLPKPFTEFTADPERFARFLARLTFRHREGIPLLETLEPGALSDLLRAANILAATHPEAFAQQTLALEEKLKDTFQPPPLWLAWITRVRRHKLERLGQECVALAERTARSNDSAPILTPVGAVVGQEPPRDDTAGRTQTPGPTTEERPEHMSVPSNISKRPKAQSRPKATHRKK